MPSNIQAGVKTTVSTTAVVIAAENQSRRWLRIDVEAGKVRIGAAGVTGSDFGFLLDAADPPVVLGWDEVPSGEVYAIRETAEVSDAEVMVSEITYSLG